ncbi:DeoR/GlpR family DNA-binding transcription regulator [Eubacterium aggregans]|uniref:DeoR/GlpR family DNA-binding transcription regulator n=1 Tax=Eubacterium aggregans TaxID=81409 RepID=UPI003F34AC9E
MFPIERREKIIEKLGQDGSITVEKLAKNLAVTPATIRRDLKYLEECNQITRTFGGAVVKEGLLEEIAVSKKASANQAQKKRIAKAAEMLIEEGQTIILDAGTTNRELAVLLAEGSKRITVVTDDILIAAVLLKSPFVEVYCTGGHVQRDVGVCLGKHAEKFFRGINADIAFLGASAIDVEMGVSSPSLEKAALKQQILECAKLRVLISDSSKFGRVSFAKICDLDRIDQIITDDALDTESIDRLVEMGMDLVNV